jgi:hypothetical protein
VRVPCDRHDHEDWGINPDRNDPANPGPSSQNYGHAGVGVTNVTEEVSTA